MYIQYAATPKGTTGQINGLLLENGQAPWRKATIHIFTAPDIYWHPTSDCAKYLNGFDRGARYDHTLHPESEGRIGDCSWRGDLSQWPDSYKDDTRRYIEAQIATFETMTQGWFWWNFKTEGAAEWDAFKLIDAGIFPAIKNGEVEYKFGTQC
jgi:aryl-phospho-beta-D-glucosidase BglC (GH1 family)